MKTPTTETLPPWDDFCNAFRAAGSPASLPGGRDGFYLTRFPVHSCNTVRIDNSSLPDGIAAKLPNQDGNGYYAQALVSPSWTKNRGVVLDVAFSSYQGGWNQMSVATFIPLENKWVHPTEVHSYRHFDS